MFSPGEEAKPFLSLVKCVCVCVSCVFSVRVSSSPLCVLERSREKLKGELRGEEEEVALRGGGANKDDRTLRRCFSGFWILLPQTSENRRKPP